MGVGDGATARAAGIAPDTPSRLERGTIAAPLGATAHVATAVRIAPNDLDHALCEGTPSPEAPTTPLDASELSVVATNGFRAIVARCRRPLSLGMAPRSSRLRN